MKLSFLEHLLYARHYIWHVHYSLNPHSSPEK